MAVTPAIAGLQPFFPFGDCDGLYIFPCFIGTRRAGWAEPTAAENTVLCRRLSQQPANTHPPDQHSSFTNETVPVCMSESIVLGDRRISRHDDRVDRTARLSRGRILRNNHRNLQGTGFVGGGVEDASTELELAARQIDGERELQRGSEEAVVLRRSDRDLEGLAAGGNALAVEVEDAEVEFDGGAAYAVRCLGECDLCG